MDRKLGQGNVQLSGAVERLQTDRRGCIGGRKTGPVPQYRGALLSHRSLTASEQGGDMTHATRRATIGALAAASLARPALLRAQSVRGAKPRADLVSSHVVPQSDAKKWRNSAPLVPSASACCTGVPGGLPLLL